MHDLLEGLMARHRESWKDRHVEMASRTSKLRIQAINASCQLRAAAPTQPHCHQHYAPLPVRETPPTIANHVFCPRFTPCKATPMAAPFAPMFATRREIRCIREPQSWVNSRLPPRTYIGGITVPQEALPQEAIIRVAVIGKNRLLAYQVQRIHAS